MVDSNTLAIGVAAGVASEAFGVTDVTPIGRQGDAGQPGGGSSGLPPGLAALLANAQGAGDAIQQGVDTGENVTDAIGELAAFTQKVQNTGETVRTRVERITEQVPTYEPPGQTQTQTQTQPSTGGGDGGGGDGRPPIPPTMMGDSSASSGSDWDLQDRQGPIGTTAKAIDNTGGFFGEVGGFVDENRYATGGALLGVAAAPFTGGASIPVGIAAAGGTAEILNDGQPIQTIGNASDTVIGGITDAASGPAATVLQGPALGANAVTEGIDRLSGNNDSSGSDGPDWRDYGSVTRRRDDNDTGRDASRSETRMARNDDEARAGGDPAADPADERDTADRAGRYDRPLGGLR